MPGIRRAGRRRSRRVDRDADEAAVDVSVRLGELELASPVVTASGTYGHGDEVARMGDVTRLGAVTAKSLLPEPWPGKPAPRLHMTASGMLNAVGLQGPGIDAWIDDDLPGLRASGARVIASLWGRTVDDYAAVRRCSAERGDLVAVEVNVSCPNLHRRAEMFAHDPSATAEVVAVVIAADLGLPLFAKLSPNVTDITVIAGAAIDAGAFGLTLVNTVMGLLVDAETRHPVLGGGGGGLSGPAIKPVALRAVHDVSRALPHVPIIGTGGVQSGVDAIEMLLAGASAVGVGTATFLDPRAASRRRRDPRVVHASRRRARRRPHRWNGGSRVNGHVDDAAHDHLALALDVGDLAAALQVVERLQPWFGVAKVGVELYAEAGTAAIEALQDKGFRVFADMKLHDIPTTVHRAARVFGRRGVAFLNFHTSGGADMLRAGVEGVKESAREAGHPEPVALGVTVLTSDPDASTLDARMQLARDAGCDGVVCRGDRCAARARARVAHDGAGHPTTRWRRERSSTRRHAGWTRSHAARTGW